jgi:amino acid transporter
MSHKRTISSLSMLLTSISAILGSGWLFCAYYAATYAGYASIFAWILGGIMIIVVAFVFAEVGAMVPITGFSARVPHFTHGSLVSFIFAWIIWLTYQTLGPTEVQAMMQYLSFYYPSLLGSSAELTTTGMMVASCLLLVMTVINTFSMRWFTKINNFITAIKVIVPLMISFTFIAYYFLHTSTHHVNLLNHVPFSPHGFSGVFMAISSGGIIFAFNAFKSAAEMGGESRNPKRALPLAIVGSVVVCMIVYLLIQVAFLLSLSPHNLSEGWAKINLVSPFGPLAAVAYQNKLSILIPIIFIGAMVGPFAAGLIYVGSAARSLYGMSKNDHVPKLFSVLTGQGNPIFGIIIYFFLGLLMLTPFQGWNSMVTFLTSLLAVTYAIMPVCHYVMRKKLSHHARPFRLPLGKIWALIAFYACTLMIYWSGWDIISKMGFVVISGLAVLFIYSIFRQDQKFQWSIKQSIWLWVYLGGITLLSYMGDYGHGKHLISSYLICLLFFILCIITFFLANYFSLPATVMDTEIKKALSHDRPGNDLELADADDYSNDLSLTMAYEDDFLNNE